MPLKVSVKNDKLIQVINLKTNQQITDLQLPEVIDQLLTIIETAIKKNVEEIVVNYDPKLGYYSQIAIDYHKIIADYEVTYLIENLVKID
ncbi:MAG: DUF6174 domain-containing protein [Cyanobacteria bacterium P01_G01_bin.49]